MTWRKIATGRSVALIIAATVYAALCFVAYGKLAGLIPCVQIMEIINQKGYDTSVLPLSVEKLLDLLLAGGILFNILTAVWFFLRWGFWKWCLTVAAVFCISSAAMGPLLLNMSPLYSLFGACCGIMAGVGWILGLTYVEFCVIGNIWVPCAAMVFASAYLIYASVRNFTSADLPMQAVRVLLIAFGGVQILVGSWLLLHYAGTMQEAFYRCVRDLRMLAQIFHTTYEAVNIFIYVFLGVAILAFDIISAKLLLRHTRPNSKQP